MKRIFLLVFIFLSMAGFSQSYNNGWIDFNKTYYKFHVGKNGLFRISQSAINAVSLGSVPAEQFQLWRNGEQVPLYTSTASGVLGSSGYVEFWGIMNDGQADTKLYRDVDYQLSDHYSLQTDTSAYFLTVNPAGNNLRFINTPNNVAANTLPAEPYFINTRGNYFKNQINVGYGLPLGSYVYSSSYDIGEGWTSGDIFPGFGLSGGFDSLNVYPGGPNVSFKFGAAGNALNDRTIRIKFFNTVVDDEPMPWFTYLKKTINNIPASYLSSPKYLPITFENTSAEKNDRMVVAFVELTYASIFNFNNKTDFSFELPAASAGNFLIIDNFNYGVASPVLLDLSSYKRYSGDITSSPGKVKFALPPSGSARKFILISEDPSMINTVSNLATKNFTDFSVAGNQGDYLIISHPVLFNNGAGVNNVDLYKNYRSSAAGGGFNVKIYNSDDLIDQFAFGIKKHPLGIKNFIQYAKDNFPSPKYVFLIGKGITYNDYRLNQSGPYADKLNLVPTFGNPASDMLLASPYGSIVPNIPVGRLSVISGNEVGNYLAKIKEYEVAQASGSETLGDKLWMKNVVHVIGGKDSSESELFKFYMNQYKNIIEDTLYGGKVETFAKSSNSAVQLISGKRIEELFNEGISLLSYFGHSSANTLEFNLSDPTYYQNQGRYPFFAVSGCTAGNNYIYDPQRITQNSLSISENFVLASQRGSIGFMASSHLGVPPYLNNYDDQFYRQVGVDNYGNSIGNIMKSVITNLGGGNNAVDYLSRTHMEEIALHGDPALKINPHPKPDYIIEDQQAKINPPFL
ncbi:MAG: C25 family cysteine peptidase, partial [Ginsengibacter sp.]